MPRPQNMDEIVAMLNKLGGIQAKLNQDGNLVIANTRQGTPTEEAQAQPAPTQPRQGTPSGMSTSMKRFLDQMDEQGLEYPEGLREPLFNQPQQQVMGAALERDALLKRIQSLQAARETEHQRVDSLRHHNPEMMQRVLLRARNNLDDIEQQELHAESLLYESGYVPEEATDITSHAIQGGIEGVRRDETER